MHSFKRVFTIVLVVVCAALGVLVGLNTTVNLVLAAAIESEDALPTALLLGLGGGLVGALVPLTVVHLVLDR